VRRVLAAAVIAALLITSSVGCSQPVDTGSPVPSQQQPFIALLALLGLGIGYAAFVHHGRAHSGGGGPVALTAPDIVMPLSPRGVDLAVDPTTTAAVGVLENPVSGAMQFEVINAISRARIGYALPSGYTPTAVAIDGQANDWFVDAGGTVDKCPAPSGPATCVPLLTFSDGLAAGSRSIAADQFFVFIARDNGAGTVSWKAVSLLGGTSFSGTYGYSGLPLASSDALSATTFSSSSSAFTLFHKDGASYVVSFPSSSTKSSFVLAPLPSFAPGNLSVALDTALDQLYFGALGTPSNAYQIAAWIGTNSAGTPPGSITSSITVASGGQINGAAGQYVPPCSSIHADSAHNVFMLDTNGAFVGFGAFI
jgi:hypothetical protein